MQTSLSLSHLVRKAFKKFRYGGTFSVTGEFEGLPKSVYVSVQKIIFFTSLVESSPLSVLKLPQNCNLLDTCAKIDMAESESKHLAGHIL